MIYRGRRLRRTEGIRSLVRETRLSCSDLICPLFLVEGLSGKKEIASMPGVYHYGLDALKEAAQELVEAGIRAVLLFGIPLHKDACGSSAYEEHGIVQEGIRLLKREVRELYVIADVCMCEYTDHGHCGILDEEGYVKNDVTLGYLNRIALSYARAGADMIAPSDMMDGHISSLRKALDEQGYTELAIMGYSAKYASSYYGPFREAAHSAPSFGDRKTYQMDHGNQREALRELAADLEEGADILMVKPALAYLDVVAEAKRRFDAPLCVYNVSGEYSMLLSAVRQGLMKEEVIMETLLSMKRAGADMIITYFALYAAHRLRR